MKKLLLPLVTLALITQGCAAIKQGLYRPILGTNLVPAHVEQRTTLATNLVSVTRTNVAGDVQMAIQTNIVQTVTPLYVPAQFITVTNGWEVAQSAETAAQVTGGLVNIVAPGIGTAVSYGLSGILSLVALYMNARLKRSKGLEQNANELNVGLVKAVEDFRKVVRLTPLGDKIDDHLIDQISSHVPSATAAGILLTKLVDAHTGNTTNGEEFVKSMKAP